MDHSSTTKIVRCSCGKSCKGIRGLEMHQLSCRGIRDMQLEDLRNYFKIQIKIPTMEYGMFRIKINAYLKTTLLSVEYSFQDHRSNGPLPATL